MSPAFFLALHLLKPKKRRGLNCPPIVGAYAHQFGTIIMHMAEKMGVKIFRIEDFTRKLFFRRLTKPSHRMVSNKQIHVI
ncbi:hypothetical protein WM94_28510 [Pseudomonas sp. ABFPK]|nr:hypothetical protein WM94_28510 [Pseudomonas sp. ABFPK]